MCYSSSAALTLWCPKSFDTPFCTVCDGWFHGPRTVSRLHPTRAAEATRLAQAGDWQGLGVLNGPGATDKLHCDVLLANCPGCGQANLRIKSTNSPITKTLFEALVSPEQVQTLQESRAQRR